METYFFRLWYWAAFWWWHVIIRPIKFCFLYLNVLNVTFKGIQKFVKFPVQCSHSFPWRPGNNSIEVTVNKVEVNCSEWRFSIFIHRSEAYGRPDQSARGSVSEPHSQKRRERYFVFVSTGMFRDAATCRADLVTAEDIYFERLQFIFL
jgi:hypothetical protein